MTCEEKGVSVLTLGIRMKNGLQGENASGEYGNHHLCHENLLWLDYSQHTAHLEIYWCALAHCLGIFDLNDDNQLGVPL